MQFLRQSTLTKVWLGPFVDEMDGFTVEGGLSLTGAFIGVSKHGDTLFSPSDNGATHSSNGLYNHVISIAESDTLGLLTKTVIAAGARPIRHDYMVVSAAAYDRLVGSAGELVSQIPVPKSRTFQLTRTLSGLIGELKKALQIGEAQLFAIDFYEDLPTNGRLASFDAITIKSGTAGGVTFDTANKGIDKTQAKIEITAVTAGTYVLNVVGTYKDASGGGTTEADVTLVVVA